MTKEAILETLQNNEHTVISTCGLSHQPEAALVGFGQTDQLKLIFGTYTTSKKYANIKENNKVAFVIGWADDNVTVQYEGTARELEKSEWEAYLNMYHAKVPSAAHYQLDPKQTYFLVTPTWIRYSDLSGDKEMIKEFYF